MKHCCDFCIVMTDPVVHRVYKSSDYYFCKNHEHLGPLGIIQEFKLDTLNQGEATP